MTLLPSLGAALALVAVHFVTPKLKWLDGTPRSRWLSFAGGASISYVFLHLLPELAHGQEVLSEEAAGSLAGFGIWGVALAALVGFYGLERLVQQDALRRSRDGSDERPGIFWVHVVSFAVYNVTIGYLLVHREGEAGAGGGLVVYAVAMALHFIVTDYGLTEAFRAGYLRFGRWILSASVLTGWALGASGEVPELWLVTITALVGGGVILNVLKEELPSERESRFTALLAGVAAFAALLWAMG